MEEYSNKVQVSYEVMHVDGTKTGFTRNRVSGTMRSDALLYFLRQSTHYQLYDNER